MGDLLPEAPLIAQQEQNIPFAKQNETSPDMLRDIREGKSKLKKPKPATSKKPPAKQARTINEILKEKIRQKMKEEEKEQMLRDKEKMLIRKKTVSSEGSRKGKK
jgi:hypothetical protein